MWDLEISIELELILVPSILLLLVHIVVHSTKVLISIKLWVVALMSRVVLVHGHHALVLLVHQIILVHIVVEIVVVANIGCCINQIWILKQIHLWVDWDILLLIKMVQIVVDVHLVHTANVHVDILHHIANLVVAIS
jgi:hypothetical protein